MTLYKDRLQHRIEPEAERYNKREAMDCQFVNVGSIMMAWLDRETMTHRVRSEQYTKWV